MEDIRGSDPHIRVTPCAVSASARKRSDAIMKGECKNGSRGREQARSA
jgi:hypothetical protein